MPHYSAPPPALTPSARVLSVNIAHPHTTEHTSAPDGITGIDRRPAAGPVRVTDPGELGAAGEGRSGLDGDLIGDAVHHGGADQAVYAFAREDLDRWQRSLGRELPNGVFGENLTTAGVDVNAALVGERWRIGQDLVLEATLPRIPCRTFAGWLAEQRWVKRFTQDAAPGPFFRVVTPGTISGGDRVEVVRRPDHDVTIGVLFRALMSEPALRPRVGAIADQLAASVRERAEKWASGQDTERLPVP